MVIMINLRQSTKVNMFSTGLIIQDIFQVDCHHMVEILWRNCVKHVNLKHSEM